MKRRVFIALVVPLIMLLLALPVLCRVGGGQSYGGGHSGGGSGGGGDFGLIYMVFRLLFYLIFEVPVVGIPLLIAIIIGFIWWRKNVGSDLPSTFYSTESSGAVDRRSLNIPQKIDSLKKERDPNFSRPLFMDFVQRFYVRVHSARGDHKWEPLEPFIDSTFLAVLKEESKSVYRVENVIVGSAAIKEITINDPAVTRIFVEVESNFTEYSDEKTKRIYYSRERWSFQRGSTVLSKGPRDISNFACPSCGNPSELRSDGTCPYCGKVVNKGDFHWTLYNAVVLERMERPPLQLSPGGLEEGSDLPTVFQNAFETERRSFTARYPDFSWQTFEARVREVFLKLQEAWMKQQWDIARPLETDYLFSTHLYMIERYREAGYVNHLENIEILSVIPVKIERDAYFESITVRIAARMMDYTLDGSGKTVEGSRDTLRTFSEYWTFIRAAGFTKDKADEEKNCPNCGAPLKISMAGICEYCESKVTSGEFYWTLSFIEQDEAYAG
ncbi:MAG: TIM44-like domain-containing protein [Vulcanimicrobiota bacterium]